MKIHKYAPVFAKNSSALGLAIYFALNLSLCAAHSSVQAAESSEASNAKEQKTYTVAPGDTLDKVINKFYPKSPLKLDVLRAAVAEQNRAAFTKGEVKMLLAGAVLTMPDQADIANSLLTPRVEKSQDKKHEYRGENGLGIDNASMHRNWVRFP